MKKEKLLLAFRFLLVVFFIRGVAGNLPGLQVSSFSVVYNAKQNVVNIHWITTTPIRNEKFVIQRSADSVHYEKIGETPGINNTATQHYYFDDSSPMSGKVFYRLEEINAKGVSSFTPSISVYKPITKLEIGIILNKVDPGSIHFTVLSPKASVANITLADITGKVWHSYNVNLLAGTNVLTSYTKRFNPGIYFLQVNDKQGGGSVMKQFTLSNVPEK